jgi:hypothetical protein
MRFTVHTHDFPRFCLQALEDNITEQALLIEVPVLEEVI